MTRPRFHLAFPVHDLAAARAFYGGVLGCPEGRERPGEWIDFDLMGHQIVAHLAPGECARAERHGVDGKDVPVRHFGLICEWSDWEALRDRLKQAGARFLVEPYLRFEGKAGEQATMFVEDPSGNALEFKAFRDDACVFDKGLREGEA
jgi:extradiol dioxygenase family protein